MRLRRNFKRSIVALATLGLLVQSAGLSLAATQARPGQVMDVALKAGGVLTGTVISAQGARQAQIPVTILQNGRPVAKVMTNDKGEFVATGLTGGVYVIAAQETQGAVRAWPQQVAPPAARDGVLFVPHGSVVNGAGLGLGALGLGAIVIGAIVAVVAVAASDDNNNSGSVSAPVTSS